MLKSSRLLVLFRKLMIGPMNDPEASLKEPSEGGYGLLASAESVAVSGNLLEVTLYFGFLDPPFWAFVLAAAAAAAVLVDLAKVVGGLVDGVLKVGWCGGWRWGAGFRTATRGWELGFGDVGRWRGWRWWRVLVVGQLGVVGLVWVDCRSGGGRRGDRVFWVVAGEVVLGGSVRGGGLFLVGVLRFSSWDVAGTAAGCF
ncbi:hypothetical protein RHMOL_Rhmol01G0261800 [Rhododendron molle]|uniref:Uncharacterized protein n=1 Tax=Rhododendron molle TaxID=49168 RepID=A0ACC0Q5V8_RHOML|nr:hypothetical protein RHMOL_Rhmol01G0261800 [Rhododendron molle]